MAQPSDKDPKDTPEEDAKETVDSKEDVKETPSKVDKPAEDVPETDTTDTEDEDKTDTTPEDEAEDKSEQEFDVEEFKKQTAAETKKEILETLKKGFGLTEEDKKESTKEGLVPPWEARQEDKPKSWKEVTEYAADLAEWKRKQEDDRIAKAQEDQDKEAKENDKRWNDYWDSELKELEESNKIPKIKDENNPNDPGRQARIKLFAKMKELGGKRQAEGLPPITSVKLIFYEHYQDEEPGGADAPVSFGKKGVASGDEGEYSYHDIHGKSYDQIKEGQ